MSQAELQLPPSAQALRIKWDPTIKKETGIKQDPDIKPEFGPSSYLFQVPTSSPILVFETSPYANSTLMLNRAQMEQERLVRQGRRRPDITLLPLLGVAVQAQAMVRL